MDRILEIGHYAAGFCGRLFVQAGHEVVRVESQENTPGWVSTQASELFLHPGKRRIQTRDPDIIAELAEKADVVIAEAAKANELERLHFDQWNTSVKVSITPFGRTGPKCNWHATSNVLLAMGGYTNLMGDAGRAPLTLPGHFVDFESGQYAYTAASACRYARETNSIDVSMLETIMSLSQFTTIKWHCAGEIRSRHGSDFWTVPPSNLFSCKDGWLYVNIVPMFWDAFATFLDHPELIIDERFLTNESRMANRDALNEIIQKILSTMTREIIQQRAIKYRVPLGVVQTFDDILEDAHLLERDYWQQVGSDDLDLVHSPALPFRLNKTPRKKHKLTRPEDV